MNETLSLTVDTRHSGEGILTIRLSGSFRIGWELPSAEEVVDRLAANYSMRQVDFDTRDLIDWDSSFLTFLIRLKAFCSTSGIRVNENGLPEGVRRLLALTEAVPEQKGARKSTAPPSLLQRMGERSIDCWRGFEEGLSLIGALVIALFNLLRGKASFRKSDLGVLVQDCGAQALGIVSLISFLVGLILAFVGAVQLKMFGAQIFVANLVALGMSREMGAMMPAIIMAGRTGAAYAAQLGTMQVNEEIDAFTTLGIPPVEFLVLPRMIALTLMMPLLCLYANLLGMIGGAVVGVGLFDITLIQYINQTRESVHLTDFSIGLVKSVIFGILVALSGCLRGMQCGRSSSAVGAAATSAVVTAIVLVIVSDALMTVICDALGI